MIQLRRWSPIIVLGLLSCTIISDNDITSAEEASQLKLQLIKATQKTAKGTTTVEFKLLYDSVQNFTDPNTSTKITRKVGYSLPTLGASKLKLRSGSTKATSFYVYYTDFKKPYTVGVQEKDSVIELYRFRYSAAKQLNRIITIINPVDNAPATVFTRDTLIYQTNLITKLTRKSGSSTTNYSVLYQTQHEVSYVSQFTPTGGNPLFQQYSGDCPNGGSIDCSEYQCQSCGSGGGSGSLPRIVISSFQVESAVVNVDLRDVRDANSSGSTSREPDTFYFHPCMLLRGQLTDGEHLLVMYLGDWWKIGAASTTNALNSSENVEFVFTYGTN